ncbi:WAS/WASL-interacting protein family member 3-like [Ischnura elegans]|uniref:WAS/WASL-interacting protein family member 3-like n=1 Tax=Ischnura elegans TaxID=197161 RepID=UPI001ED872EC|nr:WAS/WASL-interacting protein family member 3-like [Ischnura elegans]
MCDSRLVFSVLPPAISTSPAQPETFAKMLSHRMPLWLLQCLVISSVAVQCSAGHLPLPREAKDIKGSEYPVDFEASLIPSEGHAGNGRLSSDDSLVLASPHVRIRRQGPPPVPPVPPVPPPPPPEVRVPPPIPVPPPPPPEVRVPTSSGGGGSSFFPFRTSGYSLSGGGFFRYPSGFNSVRRRRPYYGGDVFQSFFRPFLAAKENLKRAFGIYF